MRVGWRRRAVLGLAVVAALAVVWSCWQRHVDRRQAAEVAQAKAVLSDYLERVRADDLSGAYRLLCADVRDGYSEAEHVDFLRGQPPLGRFEFGRPDRRSGIDGTYLVFATRLTSPEGVTRTSGFAVALRSDDPPLVCDGADWRSDRTGGEAGSAGVGAWGLRPDQFLHPWQTDDPT